MSGMDDLSLWDGRSLLSSWKQDATTVTLQLLAEVLPGEVPEKSWVDIDSDVLCYGPPGGPCHRAKLASSFAPPPLSSSFTGRGDTRLYEATFKKNSAGSTVAVCFVEDPLYKEILDAFDIWNFNLGADNFMRLQKMRYDPVQLAEEMTEMLSSAQERDPNASLESLRKSIEERETLKRERLVAATRKLRETVGSLANTSWPKSTVRSTAETSMLSRDAWRKSTGTFALSPTPSPLTRVSPGPCPFESRHSLPQQSHSPPEWPHPRQVTRVGKRSVPSDSRGSPTARST